MFSLFSYEIIPLPDGDENDIIEMEKAVVVQVNKFSNIKLLKTQYCFNFAHTQESSLRAELMYLNNRFSKRARVDYFLTQRADELGVMTNTQDKTLASRLIAMGLAVTHK